MNDLPFEYTLRRSQRAKKVRIIVTAEKIEVIAPLAVTEERICAFVKSKQAWVAAVGLKIKQKVQEVKPFTPTRYVDGAEVPYHGAWVKIRIKPSLLKEIKIDIKGQELIVLLPKGRFDVRLAVIDWMKKQAFKEATRYVTIHSEKQGLYPRSLRLKRQKSRWGSCGIHNDINLNWLLILAPPKVMEYVVVHEICHIQERNHAVQFWNLVEAHLPQYKKQKQWLKKNGANLMQGL